MGNYREDLFSPQTMRLHVDVFGREADKTHKPGPEVFTVDNIGNVKKVLLNGVDVSRYCFECCPEVGYAKLYVPGPDGKPFIDPFTMSEPVWATYLGKVEVSDG